LVSNKYWGFVFMAADSGRERAANADPRCATSGQNSPTVLNRSLKARQPVEGDPGEFNNWPPGMSASM